MKYFKKGNFIIVKDASDQEKNSFNLATINRVEIDDFQKKIKFGDGELNFSNFISFTLEDGTNKLKADFPNFSDLKTWALANFFFVAKSNGGDSGGESSVSSVFGRTGDVRAQTDDYNVSQITGALGNALSDGKIFVGNASNKAVPVDVTGDISIDNTGNTTIRSNGVNNSKLAKTPAKTWKGNKLNNLSDPSDNPLGTLSESNSDVLTITGGQNATLENISIQVKQATTTNSGYLSKDDWNTFNGKQNLVLESNSDAQMIGTLTQNSIVGDYVYRSDLGGVLYRLNALPNTTLSNWSALNEKETFLPTPIIWAKRQIPYRSYNQDPNSNGQFKEVVNFFYKFPDSWNKNDFLNYEPFIEIRLLNSSNKRFKDYQKRIFKKGARMTSPANPYGHPVPLSNRYAVGGSLWSQRTKIKLETGFVFCDKNNNYSFPENQNIGDYDASTNTPDLSSVFSAVGQYLVVQVAGFISVIDANVQVGDMICCDAFDNNSQVFSFLIQKNHKNNINTIKRFDFLPHDFFKESFFFPVQKQKWDYQNAYMNKRSVASDNAYYGQIIKDQNGNKIPRRSKTLVFGIRLGCVDPKNQNRYIFSDDSNYIRIRPVLCKMQNENENYYYGWQISNAF